MMENFFQLVRNELPPTCPFERQMVELLIDHNQRVVRGPVGTFKKNIKIMSHFMMNRNI